MIELTSAQSDTPPETLKAIKERIGLEIYDVIWNAVDLEESFKQKIAFNEKRQWSRTGYVD